jgi:hypothetical protein
MWDFRLDDREMKDAITVARRKGIISRSAQRNRRPTHDELDRLLAHFIDRRQRTPQAMLMQKVIVLALFSTRRQAEITRLTWDDFQKVVLPRFSSGLSSLFAQFPSIQVALKVAGTFYLLWLALELLAQFWGWVLLIVGIALVWWCAVIVYRYWWGRRF